MQNTELSVQSQQAIRNFELLEACADRFRETQAMVDKYGYEVLGLTHEEVKELQEKALERFTSQYGRHYSDSEDSEEAKATSFQDVAHYVVFWRACALGCISLFCAIALGIYVLTGSSRGWRLFLVPPTAYGLIGEAKLRAKRRTYNDILLNMSIAKSLEKH